MTGWSRITPREVTRDNALKSPSQTSTWVGITWNFIFKAASDPTDLGGEGPRLGTLNWLLDATEAAGLRATRGVAGRSSS